MRNLEVNFPPLPHLRLKKKRKTFFFGTINLFSFRGCRNCYHVFLCYTVQLAIITRNFHCNAIIPVVKLFWCVVLDSLEPTTDSKCNPGQGQWALLKLESCCDVIKRLFSTTMAGKTTFQHRRHSWKRMVATQADVPLAMS